MTGQDKDTYDQRRHDLIFRFRANARSGNIARAYGQFNGPVWLQYLVGRVLTLFGHQVLTQAAQHAWGMDIMRELGQMSGKTWSELDPRISHMF